MNFNIYVKVLWSEHNQCYRVHADGHAVIRDGFDTYDKAESWAISEGYTVK